MSTGFSFGTNPNTSAFGQSAFGTQPSGSITFGTPVSSAVGNTTFGQPASSGFGSTSFSGFGTQPTQQTAPNPTQQTGFGFGTPASTGFGFGTTPAATVAPVASGFGFGQTAPAQQPTGFGQTVTPQQPTGFGFGTTQQPAISTGFGFGATAPASTATGFGFGATTGPLTSTTGLSGGLSFGAVAPTTTSTTFGFGTPSQSTGISTQPTFNLGGLTSTQAPTSTGLGLGTTSQASGIGLNFPGTATTSTTGGLFSTQPQTSTGGLFGATTSTGGGLTLGTAATPAPSLGLSFGTSTASTAPSLSFGTTTTTTTGALGTGFFGSSFGLGTTTSLNVTKPTTTTTQSTGLGGIVQSTPKTGTTVGKTEIIPRDEPLPNEIQQTVESFKNFVKQQKGYSSDVARCSVKEFKKVASEIEMVTNSLNDVEKQLQTNRAIAEKLKLDTARGLQNIEMAQRTFDTPPGLQYENTGPMEFFSNLVDTFEREMHKLKIQIENTDKYVRNLGKPAALSSEDLAVGMRRLHESFVALAGRLQSVHTQVQAQKEQYLNLRKYMLHDDTNVFEKPTAQSEIMSFAINSVNYKPPTIASGPTPFSSLTHPSVIQAAVNQSSIQQPTGLSLQTPQPSLFNTTTSQTTGSLFGSTTSNTTFGQQPQSSLFGSNSTNFQLQKPPTGNKRSK